MLEANHTCWVICDSSIEDRAEEGLSKPSSEEGLEAILCG